MGCINCHHHIDLNEFNDYFVNNLLDKFSKENKTVFLLADFNTGLLNYDQVSPTNEFFDSLSSHTLLPHIVQPTKIRNNSKALIGNIYSNAITSNNISGNLTATILDHLSQLLIAPDIPPIHHLQN